MDKTSTSTAAIILTGAKLLLICFVAGFVLSLVNGFTQPTIAARTRADEVAALEELYPGGNFGDKVTVNAEDYPAVIASFAILAAGKPEGYILELAGQGYGGYMKIMASYSSDGEVIGVKLMQNEETPGLGKKAEDIRYMKKFIGKGGRGSAAPIPVTKEMLAAQQPPAPAAEDAQVQSIRQRFLTALLGQAGSGNSDSVTGATITFAGVATAVAAGSTYIQSAPGGSI